MKNHISGGVLALVLAGGAVPALADCCSDAIGCFAAVVTYGVSCEIQAIIDTVKTLYNEVSNLVSSVDGSAQSTVNAAKQTVSDTYNGMLAQTQQGSADLAAAAGQAAATVQAELHPRVSAVTGMNGSSAKPIGATDSQNATPYDRQSAPVAAAPGQPQGSAGRINAPFHGPAPAGAVTVGSPAPANLAQMQTTLINGSGPAAATVASTLGAPMAYADILQRAQQLIDGLKQTGDADAAKVNGYLTSALNSEGSGLASADQMIGNIINAPLNNMLSFLSGLLSNPTSIFDPSSNVEALEKAVTDNLDFNLDEVTKTIVRGPQANFDAAQPGFDDLAARADQAQTIAAAMQRLYQQRTKGAFDALVALVPRDLITLHAAHANLSGALTGTASRRQTYAQLRSPILARQQQSLGQVKSRTQQVKTLFARFNTQRLKGRTQASPALVQGYQNSATQKLNGYFSGRTPAQIAQQRDQLIAQARTRFASDPQTGNAVITYLGNEASKRSSGTLAAAPTTAAPSLVPPGGATTQAPVSPTPQPTAPVAWGAAGAWKPPVSAQPVATAPVPLPLPGTTAPASAAPAGSVYRPAGGFKTAQPLAPSAPAATPRPAPSSLGSN